MGIRTENYKLFKFILEKVGSNSWFNDTQTTTKWIRTSFWCFKLKKLIVLWCDVCLRLFFYFIYFFKIYVMMPWYGRGSVAMVVEVLLDHRLSSLSCCESVGSLIFEQWSWKCCYGCGSVARPSFVILKLNNTVG